MKCAKFAEFLRYPIGTVFGQDYALPHREEGLWVKGETVPGGESYVDENQNIHDEGDGVMVTDLTFFDDDGLPSGEEQWIGEGMIEDDHRFLIYEAADLDRLASIIETARKLASQPYAL